MAINYTDRFGAGVTDELLTFPLPFGSVPNVQVSGQFSTSSLSAGYHAGVNNTPTLTTASIYLRDQSSWASGNVAWYAIGLKP